MKLSKAEIADLMKAYNAYWDSYIGGDIKKIESLLDQGYTQIGSAETEVFFSKKAAIKFMSDTIDQVVGQIELRNREIKKEFLEESVLFTDLSDIYVLTGGNWVFYAKFRASSLLQQENGKWKFRHQHSSFPDIRTEEGDNIAIQKVAAENIELKDAIKRSTVQLEHKNRELEIEAALERVRARSMAMHKSEELSDAAVLLYDELRGLGLTQYFNCGYVAVNESENKQYVWNSSFDGKWLEGHFIPLTGDVVFNERYEAWKQQVPVFHQTVGGKILKKHIEFVSTILPRKIEEQTRSGFRDPTVFYCCNFGKGYLHIITDRLFNGDEESLLDRFTKVFEQTYTRFLDLQKAEAQAREAEIEAALERIRGQAIGMNSSSDLPKVMNVFYEEITRLQLSNETTDIELCLVDKELKTMRTWSAASNFSSPEQLTSMVELNKVPVLKKQFLEWKKQPPEMRKNLDLAFECGGKSWQKLLETLSIHPDWSTGIKVMYEKNIRKWYWHHAYNRYGSVVINSAEPVDPTSIPLLKRVSQVFEQTYTRFLDLQKAEAQAREAQIEAALERVRARTMAMQTTKDLLPMADFYLRELSTLEQSVQEGLLGIGFIDEKQKTFSTWISGSAANFAAENFVVPMDEHPLVKVLFDAWRKAKKYKKADRILTRTVKSQDLTSWVAYLEATKKSGHAKANIKDEIISQARQLTQFPQWTFEDAFFKQGALFYQNVNPLPDSFKGILVRFAKVFEQTYTRFLDLQKAEAQAREAEIELALERVRARTMAMQKSDELLAAAEILSAELVKLEIPHFMSGFVLVNEITDNQGVHMGIPGQGRQPKFYLPLKGDAVLRKRYKSWKNKEPIFYQLVAGEKLATHMDYVTQHFGSLEMVEKGRKIPDPVIFYCGNFKEGYLHILSEVYLNEEQESILSRFTESFQQTYTRFLDLQKAEAQAREAQIEAALERVRSRSLAMQKSDELAEVVATIYEQLTPLGFAKLGCELVLCDVENEQLIYWSATPEQAHLPECYPIDRNIHPFFKQVWKAWENRTLRSIITLKGAEKRKFDNLIFEKTAFKSFPEKVKSFIRSGKVDVFSLVTMKYGLLEAVDDKPLPEDNFQVLERFAKVFEQIYTRFLDLQKAEAQVRKAEIELALERIRAKTMAMKNSTEIPEVTFELFTQMHALGFAEWGGAVALADKSKKGFDVWFSTPNNRVLPEHYFYPAYGHPIAKKNWTYFRKQKPLHIIELEGEEKRNYVEWEFENTGLVNMPIEAKNDMLSEPYVMLSSAAMKYGAIQAISHEPMPLELTQILPRFAKVFEQTYTRFLDLQKAEAQVREAQIEAGLERVRAASMAMHKSEDLVEVATVLHNELRSLNVREFSETSIVVHDEPNRELIVWGARTGAASLEKSVFPLLGDQILQKLYDKWLQQDDFFTLKVEGAALRKHIDFVFPKASRTVLEKKAIESMPNPSFFHCAFFCMGYLELMADKELSGDSSSLLVRFAKVFDQAYIRFLDLQKAEAQAREAQIEAALERVRSAALAMHESKDLHKIVNVVLSEMGSLEISMSSALIHEFRDETRDMYFWPATPEIMYPEIVHLPYIKHQWFTRFHQARKESESFYTDLLSKKEKNRNWRHYFKHSPVPEDRQKFLLSTPAISLSTALFENTAITMLRYDVLPFSDDENAILKRFGQVFQQAYQRFLDLRKAESQAREAQIEAALERVRAKALAMHSSDELVDVSLALREQMAAIGQDQLETIAIHFIPKDSAHFSAWFAFHPPAKEVGEIQFGAVDFSKTETYYARKFIQLYNSNRSDYLIEASGQHLDEWQKMLMDRVPVFKELWINDVPNHQYWYFSDFSGGNLMLITLKQADTEALELLRRSAQVFDLAYRRYIDLKKAEAQAREAQIEAALERIRARALAMHSSSELMEVANVMREQMGLLQQPELEASVIHLYDDNPNELESWFAMRPPGQKKGDIITGTARFSNSAITRESIKAHKSKGTEYTLRYSGAKLKEWINNLKVQAPVIFEAFKGDFPRQHVYHYSDFSGGALLLVSHEEPSEEAKELQKRAAAVFDLAYRRYLDLKKSEEQAREAEIELALERVRARTMAMQHSNELAETASLLFQQVSKLGVELWGCSFNIWEPGDTSFTSWWGGRDLEIKSSWYIPLTEDPIFMLFDASRKRGDKLWVEEAGGEKLMARYQYMLGLPDVGAHLQGLLKAGITFPTFQIDHIVNFKHGNVLFITYEPHPQAYDIFERFAKVFEQTYTRFLDLQKAEAQAREAEIEAALERVRSKTMAMHNSDDVGETIVALFDEVLKLGIDDSIRCGIGIIDGPESIHLEVWSATSSPDGEVDLKTGKVNMMIHPALIGGLEAWKSGKSGFTYELIGKDVHTYYNAINNEPEYPFDIDLNTLPENNFLNNFNFSDGLLFAFTEKSISAEGVKVLDRFAGVFSQTYRRYLDLQKAEAQAREAQIEAALERVRSKTMGMHNSKDLEDIVITLFEEVLNLGLDRALRCGIGILEDFEGMETRSVNASADGTVELRVGMLNMTIHPMLVGLKKAWKKGEQGYSYYYTKKDVRKYYEALNNEPEYPFNANLETLPKQEFHRSFFFSSGILFAFSETPISEESSHILARFAAVFGQTYRRYLDLQKAELREQQAVKQASIDRLRAEIASMRNTDDLDRITPLIWKELTTLGVPFFRCGVFIVKEDLGELRVYLSTPEGKSLAAWHSDLDALPLFENIVEYWRNKKVYHEKWNRSQFKSFSKTLRDQGIIDDIKTYQAAETPPKSLDLRFVPFLQGMLYVGSSEPLSENHIDIIHGLAEAFSVAYARYEDFKQLGDTLDELKSTQSQLIQSEKMASLGELTAGIAHEIQNPLNFVNNFSEVSGELIDELQEEIDAGNLDDVKDISGDLKQNLEKINEHGKRASGIVKGMLEHSRTGDGVKELTDINKLADEYLRLAFHGLRAKDKSFNADFKMEFDEALPKIKVVPQDMGRVLLNLINNAFFAVSSKLEARSPDYKPEVIVSTKRNDKSIIVSVKDNGPGIPDEIKDKIFQPFFTTKPTGSGTGLGLSMSYDIITKGHGGNLSVKSEAGKGTIFEIQLPN